MSHSLNFGELAAQLQSPQERMRRYFQKWLPRLNGGSSEIKFGPISVDLYVEFEKRLRTMDTATLNEMLEDAHKI